MAPTPTPTPAQALQLYGLPQCDSVKAARAWLAGRGMAPGFHDFKKLGLPPQRLDAWLQALGDTAPATLLNRQGSTWRRLAPADQAAAQGLEGARRLMLAQPSLIKRPVVEWSDGRITVGLPALKAALP